MKIINSKISIIEIIKNKFFPFYNSKELKLIFKILERNKKTETKKVAMFVGGCVRNYLNNEKVNDIDIATIFSPEEINFFFKDSEVKVIETGIEHGTVTLIVNDSKFELTTLRKDINSDGRHAEVNFIENWQHDSERRDFTINAIYLDRDGKIFDPQSGVKDLKNKVIKFIGDPNIRIEEDYLRIIRFIRFSIQYKSELDIPTLKIILLNLNGINKLSKERVLNELFKILDLKNLSFLNHAENLKNIFLLVFPEIKYIERLSKLNFLPEEIKLKKKLILAILLIDDTSNIDYFCHKYKVSNALKHELSSISILYQAYKKDKNFLKENLKKNIYLYGDKNIKKLITLIFFIDKKKDFKKDYLIIIKNIEEIKLPKFPYDGQFLISKGVNEGRQLGVILNELKKDWMINNFSLSEKEVIKKIDKFKIKI